MPPRFSKPGNRVEIVGRTPWSARVPLDPLFAPQINLIPLVQSGEGAGCGPGVRPTVIADCRTQRKRTVIGRDGRGAALGLRVSMVESRSQ